MQTRRRLLQQDTTGAQEEGGTLIPQTSVQQLQRQQKLYASQLNTHSAVIYIDDNQSQAADEGDDNKYKKAERQWDFRTISSKLQINSGKALQNYIQQPLSAVAAALVTGNPQNTLPITNSKEAFIRQDHLTEQETINDLDENILDKENILVMASRNRTGEFNNAVRSLQARNITQAVNIRDPRKAKQVQSYSEFMMVARLIGKNIASTYAKLEKLTILAKRKTLFDDRPQDIQELTYIIKGDLNALNKQIGKLQEICKDQRRTINGKHLVSHSSNMVFALQSKLANMSSDFKQILEVRSENLKHQKSRREQFVQSPLTVNTIAPHTAKKGSLLLNEDNQSISIDMSAVTEGRSLLGAQQRQQQIAIYDDSDRYVQERAETMQNIESTIVELGGIFQQLAYMVKEQEEIVERIDTNVEDAELNIEAAHSEILKYFQSISKNRWLIIKIFGILIFFFIFFIVFMT